MKPQGAASFKIMSVSISTQQGMAFSTTNYIISVVSWVVPSKKVQRGEYKMKYRNDVINRIT